MASTSLHIVDSLAAVPASRWDALIGARPLLSHAFLHALHETGCASPRTGWTPCYITAWKDDDLIGAMPLYRKAHSYGEYVFDWSWADAYRRHGRRYYPKLVSAVPFTPATGPRLIARDASTRKKLLDTALSLLAEGGFSSLHVLFPEEREVAECARAGMVRRDSIQFHWANPGYRDFADFLSTMNHTKRKKILQERRKVADVGIEFIRMTGRDIETSDWAFFYRCYSKTYREHHSTPYLSPEFFLRIGATLADSVLLVIGKIGGKPVCAALDIHGGGTLWGRYWGTMEHVSGLHFEACYYQAIEFCIERRINLFEGGAQGSHKLARGFLPVTTRSLHAVLDPDFARAIDAFVREERGDVARTVNELERASPFKEPAFDGAGPDSPTTVARIHD
jgi:predicted N-acyltransferase